MDWPITELSTYRAPQVHDSGGEGPQAGAKLELFDHNGESDRVPRRLLSQADQVVTVKNDRMEI